MQSTFLTEDEITKGLHILVVIVNAAVGVAQLFQWLLQELNNNNNNDTLFYVISAIHRYRSGIGHVIILVWEDPGTVAILGMQVNSHWHIHPGKFIPFQNPSLPLPVQIRVFRPVSLIFSDFDGKPEFNFRLHWKTHELKFKTKFPEIVLRLQLTAKPQTTPAYCVLMGKVSDSFCS